MRFLDIQRKKRSPSRAKESIFDVVGLKILHWAGIPAKIGKCFFTITKPIIKRIIVEKNIGEGEKIYEVLRFGMTFGYFYKSNVLKFTFFIIYTYQYLQLKMVL